MDAEKWSVMKEEVVERTRDSIWEETCSLIVLSSIGTAAVVVV